MFKQFINLMSPEAPPTGGGNSIPLGKEMSKEDMFNFLNTDDEAETIDLNEKPAKDEKEEPNVKRGKTKASKEDEDTDINEDDTEDEDDEDDDAKDDDELEELLEDDEPSEDKLESMTPPRRKEILKAYPDLFKKFPYLERAYYREQQFTKIFPDPQDAREAVEKSATLDSLEKDLMDGNIKPVLMAVKDDPKVFNKVVNGYMKTLAEVDEKAYHHIIANTIRHTVQSMVTEARESGQEILQQAAQVLHQYIFGNSKWTPPSELETGDEKPNTKESELTKREREFNINRFNTAQHELEGKVNGAYRNTIEANIDPKDQMTDYVKKMAVRQATEELQTAIESDARFKSIVDKLWEKAISSNYSKESVDKIRSAFVSKAKTLLPSVIKKARIDALKGMGKRVRENDSDKDDNPKEKVQRRESRSSSDNGRGKSNGKIPAGMSSLEYLMSED